MTFMLFSTATTTLLGAIRTLVLARFLSPAEYGYFNIINMILNYVNYADLGTNSGVLYRSSVLIGEGKITESMDLRKSMLFFTMVLSGGLSAILFASLALPDYMVGSYATALFFAGVAIPIFLLQNYFHVEARVRDNFRLLGMATVLGTLASLIFTMLVVAFGASTRRVEIMVITGLAGAALSVMLLAGNLRMSIVRELDWGQIWRLMRLGIPLTIIPIAYVLFQSVDRWVIVNAVPSVVFGYYAFGTTIGMMLNMLPNTLATVLSTRLIRRFGRSQDPRDSSVMVLTALWLSAYSMAFIAGGIVLALPYLLAYIFPQFLPGTDVITILVVANGLLFAIPVTSNFLLASEKKGLLLVTLCGAILVESILVFVAQRAGGIEGASYAVLCCDTFLSIFLVGIACSLLDGRFSWHMRRMAGLFLPFAVCIASALLLKNSHMTGQFHIDGFSFMKSFALYVILGGILSILAAWIGGVTTDVPMHWPARSA